MIAKLLHICNAAPYCLGAKEDFYAVKSRLLERYGTPDGYDVQKIEGKQCWGCDGSGTFTHTYSGDQDYCLRCGGSGWFKHPVWITLKRYRFGRYVFHTPQDRSYKQPEPEVTNIVGYVRHAHYGYRQTEWAALAFSLLFARKFFWPLAKQKVTHLWIIKPFQRRCITCQRHTWSTRWRCRTCEVLNERAVVCDEIPF